MTKKDIKNDIESFKRVRCVVEELITNFSEDAINLLELEEFLQLLNARIFLDKMILRLEKLIDKASNP